MSLGYIKSLVHQLPEGRIDNQKVMEYFRKANDDWLTDDEFEKINKQTQLIFGYLGIKTRAVYKDIEKENSVALAVNCCKRALKESGLAKEDIDCVIAAGLSNPFREPTFANIISHEMGFNNIDFFDVNDTCSGAIKGIDIATAYIQAGRYNNVLVFACENAHEFIIEESGEINKFIDLFKIEKIEDYNYKVAPLCVGSGAGALIISSKEGGCKLLKSAQFRDFETWDRSWLTHIPYVRGPETVFGSQLRGFWVESTGISKFLLAKVPEFVKQKLDEWKVDIEDINYFTTPQLGKNITSGIIKGLNLNPELSLDTYQEHGNMGAANVLVNLGEGKEKGKFKSGDKILCIGGGGGLSILLALLEWG